MKGNDGTSKIAEQIKVLVPKTDDLSLKPVTLTVDRENRAGQFWHTSLIPALGQGQADDLCEFKASLFL